MKLSNRKHSSSSCHTIIDEEKGFKALSFGQDHCMTITKNFPGTNTLAYLATASVTKKKGLKSCHLVKITV
jgi:hypothetical protein